MMIKVLVIDEREQVRRGLKMRLNLEPDLYVVGEASTPLEGMELSHRLVPDIVLMDLQSLSNPEIEALQVLQGNSLCCSVVILTVEDDAQTRSRALEAGVAAFVSKRESPEQLIAAIRKAATKKVTHDGKC